MRAYDGCGTLEVSIRDQGETEAAMSLAGIKIAALVESEFEDLELLYPVMRFQEEGADVTIIGTGSAETYKGKHGLPIDVDPPADKVTADFFTAIIPPGGGAPARLRRSEAV